MNDAKAFLRTLDNYFSIFVKEWLDEVFEDTDLEKKLEDSLEDIRGITIEDIKNEFTSQEGFEIEIFKIYQDTIIPNLEKILNAIRDIRKKNVQSLSYFLSKDITKPF